MRKIEDIWGDTLLENLTLKKVSDEYDKLLSSKKATKSALHKLNSTLSLVMDEAVANGLVEANPGGFVKAPRPKAKGERRKSARPLRRAPRAPARRSPWASPYRMLAR